MCKAVITGVGAYYPIGSNTNSDFLNRQFLQEDGSPQIKATCDIIECFESITGISQRRLLTDELTTSDMAAVAGEAAINSAGIDRELLDYIIVAHNWGDVRADNNYYNLLPNLAAKVKNRLGIANPRCVAYDILFGCPGWLEAVRQADLFIRSGIASHILVIGADSVSRVVDPVDIDSMLFSDGAGAIVLQSSQDGSGILGSYALSHCLDEIDYLSMGASYDSNDQKTYLKMKGRQVFRYALETIPAMIIECLESHAVNINDVRLFLVHHANARMIRCIGEKLFAAYDLPFEKEKIPVNISLMGNNSVATIPTLLNDILKGEIQGASLQKGDLFIMASVGAGMHANCVLCRY